MSAKFLRLREREKIEKEISEQICAVFQEQEIYVGDDSLLTFSMKDNVLLAQVQHFVDDDPVIDGIYTVKIERK